MSRMMNGNSIGLNMRWLLLAALIAMRCSLFVSRTAAQDVVVSVTTSAPVLPPQAGEYLDNPGKFFVVKLLNTTDERQLVHMGMHLDMLFPDQAIMVATPANGHIPRNPIVLEPQQAKTLNPVEMKNLFTHFSITEIGISERLYKSNNGEVTGLLPEGQYELYMQAYKWDPTLTQPVQLNKPDDGRCLFNICYKAQAPKFLTPMAFSDANDPLGGLAVAKLDINNPVHTFSWTPPTLACNASMVSFNYDVKVVKLGALMPDEAMEGNTIAEYQTSRLSTPTFTIPPVYYSLWKQDTTAVYAIRVTANSLIESKPSDLNFSLVENEGKSDIMLFRFYDPTFKPAVEDDDEVELSAEDGEAKTDSSELYVFEQPTIIAPKFSDKTARKVFVGDSIPVEWRKAWYSGGKGEREDTVKFKYTLALYRGNSADTPKGIFAGKPVFTRDTEKLKDTIRWKDIKDKVVPGDYLMMRVTAKSTNAKSLKMLPDSLNYKDFALTEHFDETYTCGNNTSKVENKTPVTEIPKKGTKLWINEWVLTLNDDVEMDKETHAMKGTGWINWSPGGMNVRVAVKFDGLKANSDNVVFEGICRTYPKDKDQDSEYTAEEAVDSLFSAWGLDNIWGDLGLPSEVANKVGGTVDGEIDNLAKKYDLGKYYSYFKKAENQWDKWMQGDAFDLYLPTELPDTIAKLLPDDFSLQIASMMYAPSGAVMNIIGEFTLPKSDVLDNDVLIFGAPRLCISSDQFLPEDGTLALLSNFKIKDPSSDWSMTFKAPTEPLRPTDGCFVSWENNDFSGLSVEIAMTIPNLKRVVDGKVQDMPPVLDLTATIKDSWGDWIGRIQMDPFEVEDLPGWIFSPGKDIIFDHSYEENHRLFPDIARLPITYDPSKVNSYTKNDWNAWQGVYIDEISVQFPKWAVFGKGEQGLKIAGQKMLFDNSGITCDIAALNMLETQTGKAGGWEFDLDLAKVLITQNNFDSCHIEGRFAIPLFGAKYRENGSNDTAKADDKSKADGSKTGDASKGGNTSNGGNASKGGSTSNGENASKGGNKSGGKSGGAGGGKSNPDQGKVRFVCDIRHLTDGETVYYTYDKEGKRVEHKKKTYGEDSRMAYYFRTQQIDSLDFSCFVADVQPIKDQTYFVVTAIDRDQENTDTYVELNLAAQINIADENSTLNTIREYAKKLPMKMDFKGIHVAKMRLANFSYKDTAAVYKTINTYFSDKLATKRLQSEQAWASGHNSQWVGMKNKELKLTDKCFLDLGEWSLSSPKKKIGPFSVELKEFKPGFDAAEKKLSLALEGMMGFMDDKVSASVGIDITSDLTIPSDYTNISGYDLSWGGIEFRSVELNADFGMLKMNGRLDVQDDDKNGKGYAGKLGLEIKELFTVDVEGGYFTHKTSDSEKKDNKDLANATADDGDNPKEEYAWGYFTANMKMDAKTSPLRFDPLVVTRLSGGFYYNCRPVYNAAQETFGDPECRYGMLGISFGMGLAATSGEETLSGNMDLNVIYDRANHRLSTFAFKGNVKAVSGIIDANMMLLYQNDNTDRFLSLDITVEAGLSNGAIGEKVAELNKKLEEEKEELDRFQEQLDDKVKNFAPDHEGNLQAIQSDYKNTTSQEDKKKNEEKGTKDKEATGRTKTGGRASASFSLAMKITWREQGVNYNKPKWHLYLGEPAKDKRCYISLINFKSSVVSVDIGADAYLCIGNELPNNGQLPPIDKDITDFLNGGSETVNTNADLAKAENSRSKAVREMLGSVNGGVMVGASAWGYINVDLGLFYGYLKAIAGFDMSLVNYGNNAFCVNLHKTMGRNGWYAMGQFYAYLAAKFGLHIKLGRLIDKRIDIIDAGIGGVFECGLPSPSWVEGRARVKISLLGGLVKINKKFQFECGDRCVAFMGNALDDFNLFDSFTIGSDSLGIGWDAQNALTTSEAEGRAMFATTAALNSQYRLVDPSTLNDIKDDVHEDSLFNIHASRTYIFNLDQDKNTKYGTNGVRLWEFDSEQDFNDCFKYNQGALPRFKAYMPSLESSITFEKRDLNCDKIAEDATEHNLQLYLSLLKDKEVPVAVRDKQGTKYHLSSMHLEPGKVYMLMLTGTAYEVLNGQRYWCEMVDTVRMKTIYQKWMQHKFYFFRTKEKEDVSAAIDDLQPYIALAYPAPAVGQVTNDAWANDEAYPSDLRYPTIALREDLRNTDFAKGGVIEWTLRTKLRNSETFLNTEVRKNTFVVNGSCINMEPESPFTLYSSPGTDDNPLVDNLRITYTQLSYSALINWMKQHKRSRLGVTMSYYSWYYKHWEANEANVPQDSVHHALYIADWLKNGIVDGAVDVDTLDLPKRVVVLYDSWFRRSSRYSWSMALPSSDESKFNGSRGFTDPLPYERPFVGVRPTSPGPKYTYPEIGQYSVDPYTLYEKGYIYEKMDAMRLKDPYAYFSYLSNWVFIGGRAINSYNFDDIRTPHASETLTFSYNTMDIAGSSQVKGLRTSDAVKAVRDSMMNVWNDWHYNHDSQPQFPLPTRLGADYDVAFPNQDGKAQVYYTPWLKNFGSKNDQMQYGLNEFWKDFAAPYLLAEGLSDALYDISKELTDKWTKTCTGSQFNQSIKDWNNLHRGQYLTVECRGFQVKVPYYQFPLIFGDCCYNGYDPITDRNISEGGRAFGSSIGQSNIIKARWKTYVSNLFWFRLRGGYPWNTSSDFNQFYTERHYRNKKYKFINRDEFDAQKAMSYISDLHAYVYRVNAYDTKTGLYVVKPVGAAGSNNDEASSFRPHSVPKPDDYTWATWLTNGIGRSPVLVNGKEYKPGTSSSTDYTEMETTPDVPPVDNSGTMQSGGSAGNSAILHKTGVSDQTGDMNGTTRANEYIYSTLKQLAQSDLPSCAKMLKTIKSQDQSLYSTMLARLYADMPEIKRQLDELLNPSPNISNSFGREESLSGSNKKNKR